MELLRIEHLSKVYGEGDNRVYALDDVSFTVEKGQFLAIIGPSGSGKSTLLCDPVWSGEAIGNVLKNAMEHSPQGGTITLTGRDTPIFTEITVQDQGEGFPPEELPRIFERFYRGKSADPQSCGIGLSLSRSILAAQNGTIRAENTKTGGKIPAPG